MLYLKKTLQLIFGILILIVNLSCFNKGKMVITKLHPYSEIDSIGHEPQKYKFYLVQNFELGNKQQFEEIKKFAEENLDKDYKQYAIYDICFYKESSKTNLNYRQTPSDLILWHGDDLVFDFAWSYGKSISYNAYKDGKVISK